MSVSTRIPTEKYVGGSVWKNIFSKNYHTIKHNWKREKYPANLPLTEKNSKILTQISPLQTTLQAKKTQKMLAFLNPIFC